MTQRIRTSLAALLVGVLVLTGHSMAVARGMPGAAGYVEYCIGQSAVMVPVDADGTPTGAPHICPEFSASLFVWVFENTAEPRSVLGQSHAVQIPRKDVSETIRETAINARAPPVVVVT